LSHNPLSECSTHRGEPITAAQECAPVGQNYTNTTDATRLTKTEDAATSSATVTLTVGAVEVRNYGQPGTAEEVLIYAHPNVRLDLTAHSRCGRDKYLIADQNRSVSLPLSHYRKTSGQEKTCDQSGQKQGKCGAECCGLRHKPNHWRADEKSAQCAKCHHRNMSRFPGIA